MRRPQQPCKFSEDLYVMEALARGILWVEGFVVAFLSLSLLMLGVGLFRPPVPGQAVLRGLLTPLGLW